MLHKFLFCRDATDFTPNTIVYIVWAGESACERFILKTIDLWAAEKGYFFRPYDQDTEFWLEQCSKKLRPQSKAPILWVGRKDMQLNEFYSLVEDGIIQGRDFNGTYSKDECRILQIIDSDYFFSQSSKTKKGVPPGKRKYLSALSQEQRESFIASCIIILLLFLADSFINTLIF